MAAVLNDQPEAWFSFPIAKTEKTSDGDLLVYGKCTDGTVDSDEQIVDPEWSAGALKNWLATGANLRVQHQAMRDPAGVGLEIELDRDGDKAHWLKALVVEPVAKRLVEKGALRAFSVGIMRPKVVTHAKARGGLIAGGDLGEVSLVDRPANRNCAFNLVKAAKDDGKPEWVGQLEGDEQMITKMLKPSPADVAKAIENGKNSKVPQPEQGAVPEQSRGLFADPVSNRLAAAIAEERTIEKRQFTSEQREHAASDGHALPDGSYPIDNVSDLHNAVQAIGRAKNPSAARAHIRQRASALGASDELPESWKSEAPANGPLAAGLRKSSASASDDDADDSSSENDSDDDDSDDDKPPWMKKPAKKSGGLACSECGTIAMKNAAFCAGCGARFTGKAESPAAGVSGKRVLPGPDDRNVQEAVPPTWGNEPKGGDESHTAGAAILGAGSSGEPVGQGGTTLKGKDAPYSIIRAHDAFCPVYDFSSVLKEYPSLTVITDALDVAEVQEAALKAVSSGNLELGERLLRVARSAGDLAKADKNIVSDARADLHKSFTEMYPDVSLSPGEICASDFQRGYLSAGTAPLSRVPPMSQSSVSMPPEAPSASSFTREALTSGHMHASPGKSAGGMKEAVTGALAQVHDQIQGMFPAICPLSKAEDEPDAEKMRAADTMAAKPPSTATLVKPKKPAKPGRGDKKRSKAGLEQQAAMDAAVKQLVDATRGIGELRHEWDEQVTAKKADTGAQSETLKVAAAQLSKAATSLSEKSAQGSAGANEVAALREKIGELHGLIIGASQQERQNGGDAAALTAAAAKLEKAADTLALHKAAVAQPQAPPADMGMVQEQLRNLQALVMSSAQKGDGGQNLDIGALRSQLGELQGMITSSQLARQQDGRNDRQEPATVDTRMLDRAAEQLTKAAAALQEKPAPMFTAPQPQATQPADSLLAMKLEKLQDQLSGIGAQLSTDTMRSSKVTAEEGSGPSRALKAAAEQLAKATGDINAMRERLAEQQEKLYAERLEESRRNDWRDSRRDGQREDVRALKSAASKLTKAAAVLSARPEVPEDVRAVLGSKADAQEVSDLGTKLTELQDLINKIGAQPDPAKAPVRGIVSGPAGQGTHASGGAVPVERRSLVDEASTQNRDEKYRFLKSLTASGDPMVREQAEGQIRKMLLGP